MYDPVGSGDHEFDQTRYIENGYDSRRVYLKYLAGKYGLNEATVQTFADVLGPIEDFDALVTTLDEYVACLDTKDWTQL